MEKANKAVEIETGVKGVYHMFQDKEELNDIRIERYIYDKGWDSMYNIRQAIHGNEFMTMRDGGYVKMYVGNKLMMSDTKMERQTNAEFIRKAHGDVLIGGLGIGMLIENLKDIPGVLTITVLENNSNLISLIEDRFKHPKVTIIYADVFTWKSDRKFDCIWMDIWPEISEDNLDEMSKLHRKYSRMKKNKDSFLSSWMHRYLQNSRRRSNQRRKYYSW